MALQVPESDTISIGSFISLHLDLLEFFTKFLDKIKGGGGGFKKAKKLMRTKSMAPKMD